MVKFYNKEGNPKDRRTYKGDTNKPTSGVGEDDSPSAFDVKGSYSFRDTFGAGADTTLSLGYGQSLDSVRLYLPKSQLNVAAIQGLGSGADLALTYTLQKNYDKKDAKGKAVPGKDGKLLKGASNNIFAARLSYVF